MIDKLLESLTTAHTKVNKDKHSANTKATVSYIVSSIRFFLIRNNADGLKSYIDRSLVADDEVGIILKEWFQQLDVSSLDEFAELLDSSKVS